MLDWYMYNLYFETEPERRSYYFYIILLLVAVAETSSKWETGVKCELGKACCSRVRDVGTSGLISLRLSLWNFLKI